MRWWYVAAIVLGGCSSSQATNGDAGPAAAIGADFVQQRGCPTCHQPSDHHMLLAGNLDAVTGTQAYPANLTPDRTTGIGGWADEQIIRAIRYGVDPTGAELCPTMPRFETIGDVEASAIVAYLRSLPAVTHAIPMSFCPPVKPTPGGDMAMPPSDM